jgi:hypothetical protein
MVKAAEKKGALISVTKNQNPETFIPGSQLLFIHQSKK